MGQSVPVLQAQIGPETRLEEREDGCAVPTFSLNHDNISVYPFIAIFMTNDAPVAIIRSSQANRGIFRAFEAWRLGDHSIPFIRSIRVQKTFKTGIKEMKGIKGGSMFRKAAGFEVLVLGCETGDQAGG